MKKMLFLFSIICLAQISADAQNLKDKIDKQAKSNAQKEQEAKADVYIMDKKKITDSTTFKNAKSPALKKKKYINKKRRCTA